MAAKHNALIPLLFTAPLLGVTLGSCKSLNTDLGRNVYERELEDTFTDSPAGIIATTSGNRLVVFREHSFVAEPPATDSDSDGNRSQGVQFLREATYRLAEARANSTEAMIALKNAGMSDKAILASVPSATDWTTMFMETLVLSQQTTIAEFSGWQAEESEWDGEWEEDWGGECGNSCDGGCEWDAKEWDGDWDHDRRQGWSQGSGSTGSWFSADKEDWGKSDFRISWSAGAPEGATCDSKESCEPIEFADQAQLFLAPIPPQVPHVTPSELSNRFGGTAQKLDSDRMWRVQYSNSERKGHTVTLTVQCLDAQSEPSARKAMQAEYTLRVEVESGAGVQLIKIPTGWSFVKLSAIDSKPMYAAFF